ncbi:MAG: tRNA-dihydrouridine synthase [Candidatus Liptonbacteria bacterium]
MNYGFWKDLEQPFSALAPMAEVTDLAFRKIILESGRPDVFYTEFVSADGLASRGRDRLLLDLRFSKKEHPIVAQFFGSKPETIYEAARTARELGFDGVDINMGCPDRKVIKQGAGIGLYKTLELVPEIIAAAREGAGLLPVSVKTRLGYGSINMDWIDLILKCKIPVLIVHLRTMKEMSKVPAHWEVVPEIIAVAKKHKTLVVGNGDVMDMDEARRRASESGANGVMIGRGIFTNPWLFNEKVNPAKLTPKKRLALLRRHIKYFEKAWGDKRNFNILKKFFKIYCSGWDGAKELRTKLMECKDRSGVKNFLR